MTNLRKHVLAAGCVLALMSASAMADALLLDRGLPDTNINNDAGAQRSNVAWAFGDHTSNDYFLVGDTITNTGSQAWTITTLRMWTIGTTTTATLWGGTSGNAIGVISNATYADGITTYQGQTGRYLDMHQVDFAVNITLAAGDTLSYFFDGTGNSNGSVVVPFLHASNAALGGVTADGADDTMLYAETDGVSILDSGTWTSLGNGWDKASDLNVQAFGSVIPEPASFALVGAALLGLAATRRRRGA